MSGKFNSSSVTPIRVAGPAFTTVVGTITHGEDPAQVGGPPSNRNLNTITRQHIHQGNQVFNGKLDGSVGVAPKTASFLVSNNNFANARWAIILGEYRLQLGDDWVPQGTAIGTATEIATAISELVGPWTASNGGTATVSITFDDPLNEVVFELEGTSPLLNFTTLVPDDGFMAPGTPTLGSPDTT